MLAASLGLMIMFVAFVAHLALCVARRSSKLADAPRVRLEDYVHEARTGDLLMFRHSSTDSAHDLASPFSHVGVVVRHPITSVVHVLETHGAGDAAAIGIPTGGVHLHDLRDRVLAYAGRVWVYSLNGEPHPRDVSRVLADTNLFRVPFDSNYKWSWLTCAPSDAMFCAQFAATVLARFGVVREEHSTCLTPLDVLHLPVRPGFAYGAARKIATR